MHTNHPKEDPLVELGYEIRDIDIPAIRKWTIGFFIFGTVSFAVVWGWFMVWGKEGLGYHRDVRKPVPTLPYPIPQSNVETKVDIMAMRQNETKALTGAPTYTDSTKQFVRVPIDRAMQDYIMGGFPEPTATIPARSVGNTIKQNATGKSETAN